jgi:predicted RNA-binding Zn-ribbon protein involved in translation (DUF1610 family)
MRESQRNLALGGLAVVLLAAAVYLYFSRSRVGAELPTQARVQGVCLACERSVEITHAVNEIAPFRCPECGEQAVYPWKYCYQCNKRFVPNPVRYPGEEHPRLPSIPVCPLCGGSRTGGYNPNNPRQAPEGDDAPLPAWPIP